MSRLSRTIANYTERYVRRTRQVRAGSYSKPRGLKRGLVQVGTCGQIVNADRLSNIAPGAGVLVASDGGRSVILSSPGPPPTAAPATTIRLSGTPAAPIDDPPGMPGPERRAVFVSNSDPRNMYVVRFVGAVPTEVEVAVEEPAGFDMAYDWVGTGNGRAVAFASSGVSGGFPMEDALVEVDLLTLNINSTYTMPTPASTRPGGTTWNMSPPTLFEGAAYWIEIQPDDGAQQHTYKLMRAPFGFLQTATVINSLTVSNTVLLPSDPVFDVTLDDSFWKLWFAGDRWIWQGQVTAYNPLGADPLENIRVEFLPTPTLLPAILTGGSFTSYPRDGNLGGAFPGGPNIIAGRRGDDNVITEVWPDTATIDATDQFGNIYSGTAAGAGSLTVYRGDITDPTPTLDVATYNNPASLIGEFAAPKLGIFTGA